MNFSRFRYGDIQSWWEVPSIAYFCSLFRTAFNLLDFDIEELEEALLTDGTEESASSLLTELIVRLLNGCLGNNDISAFNYQMYLRRLFRQKCQETRRYNPFNTDIDFQFLPLRTKVEILYALCDFRLDAEDVFELFKNLEAESLRVEPLGWDDNYSAYWYFYGTRLYREDIIRKPKSKNKKKKGKESKKRSGFFGDVWLDEEDSERVWQVVCFTEEDWSHLTEKFSRATSKVEKELYRSLSQNFLPEIPRLFQEKERLQRKRTALDQTSHAQADVADAIAADLYFEMGLSCTLSDMAQQKLDEMVKHRQQKLKAYKCIFKPKSEKSLRLTPFTIQKLLFAGTYKAHQVTSLKKWNFKTSNTRGGTAPGSLQYIEDNILRALQSIEQNTWQLTKNVKRTSLKTKLEMIRMQSYDNTNIEPINLSVEDDGVSLYDTTVPIVYSSLNNSEWEKEKSSQPDLEDISAEQPSDHSIKEVQTKTNHLIGDKESECGQAPNMYEVMEHEVDLTEAVAKFWPMPNNNEEMEYTDCSTPKTKGENCLTSNNEKDIEHGQNVNTKMEDECCSEQSSDKEETAYEDDIETKPECGEIPNNDEEMEDSAENPLYQISTQIMLNCSIWLYDISE